MSAASFEPSPSPVAPQFGGGVTEAGAVAPQFNSDASGVANPSEPIAGDSPGKKIVKGDPEKAKEALTEAQQKRGKIVKGLATAGLVIASPILAAIAVIASPLLLAVAGIGVIIGSIHAGSGGLGAAGVSFGLGLIAAGVTLTIKFAPIIFGAVLAPLFATPAGPILLSVGLALALIAIIAKVSGGGNIAEVAKEKQKDDKASVQSQPAKAGPPVNRALRQETGEKIKAAKVDLQNKMDKFKQMQEQLGAFTRSSDVGAATDLAKEMSTLASEIRRLESALLPTNPLSSAASEALALVRERVSA